MPSAKKLSSGERLIVKLVLAMVGICALTGIALSAYALSAIWRGYQAQSWPTVPGTIVAAEVKTEYVSGDRGTDGDDTYIPLITYAYKVDGRELRSTRRQWTDASETSPARAERVLANYPIGSTVSVYHHPARPELAVLDPGVSRNSFLLLFAGLIFAVAPTFGFGLPIWRRLREQRGPRSDRTRSAKEPEAVTVVAESTSRLELRLAPGSTGVSTAGWLAAITGGLGIFGMLFFGWDILEAPAPATMNDKVLVGGFIAAILAGAVLAVWWARLRYTRERIVLTRDQADIEKRWLGWTRRRTVRLAPGARAGLRVDHEDQGEPVHAVVLEPADPRVHIAVTLTEADKQALLERINSFLTD
jgi:hypothetical protein